MCSTLYTSWGRLHVCEPQTDAFQKLVVNQVYDAYRRLAHEDLAAGRLVKHSIGDVYTATAELN